MVEKWDLGFYFSSESQWLEGWKILEPQDTEKETRAGGTGPHLLAREKGSSGLRPLHEVSCDSSGWLLPLSCLGHHPTTFLHLSLLLQLTHPTSDALSLPGFILRHSFDQFPQGSLESTSVPWGEGMMNL